MRPGTEHNIRKALLYCRVSDKAQEKHGDGLGSQEAWSREYCRYNGYEVVEVFREVLTGGEENRPVLKSLIKYLESQNEKFVVVVDDISRFARDNYGHYALKRELKEAGGILESPAFELNDSADSQLMEGVMVTFAAHHRRKNAEQTRNRMNGRLLNGYWPFRPPTGYEFGNKAGHPGRMLVRNEPLASLIEEGLEGFASGRFETQAELVHFFDRSPLFPKNKAGIRFQTVVDLLRNPVVAGYVEAPKWGVALRKGQHDPLIDFATFQRIQEKLDGRVRTAVYRNQEADFPLRGMVACEDCGRALTACWSTGRNGTKHPYYLCHFRGCPSSRKSIRREVIESAFEAELEKVTPSESLTRTAFAMFKDAWKQRIDQAAVLSLSCEREAKKVQKEIDALLDRIVKAETESVVSAYEKRITSLERQKIALEEKRASFAVRPRGTLEELFEPALRFLSSPLNLWKSGDFNHRKLVLKLTFSEPLSYCRKNGFRTAKTTIPFKMLQEISIPRIEMASPRGIEPRSSP